MMASRWTRTGLVVVALGLWSVGAADAAPCGTIASPTACALTVNGTTTYTASNFTLISSAGLGGGNVYEGADIDIDIFDGGGGTFGLTFSKNASGPTPGIVFFANPGQTSGFLFSYDLVLTAAQPGTAAFAPDFQVSILDSHTQNGLATVQGIVTGPAGVSCVAFTAVPFRNCTLPATTVDSLSFGNFLTLTGNGGNTSALSFTHAFGSTFEAAPPTPTVPEPASLALLGIGLAVFVKRRR